MRSSTLLAIMVFTLGGAAAGCAAETAGDSEPAADVSEDALSARSLVDIKAFSDADFQHLFQVAESQFANDFWGDIGGVNAARVTGQGGLTRSQAAAAVRAAAKKYYAATLPVKALPLATGADTRKALEAAGVYASAPPSPELSALLFAMGPMMVEHFAAFRFTADRQPRLALVDLATRQILIFGGGYPDD